FSSGKDPNQTQSRNRKLRCLLVRVVGSWLVSRSVLPLKPNVRPIRHSILLRRCTNRASVPIKASEVTAPVDGLSSLGGPARWNGSPEPPRLTPPLRAPAEFIRPWVFDLPVEL